MDRLVVRAEHSRREHSEVLSIRCHLWSLSLWPFVDSSNEIHSLQRRMLSCVMEIASVGSTKSGKFHKPIISGKSRIS